MNTGPSRLIHALIAILLPVILLACPAVRAGEDQPGPDADPYAELADPQTCCEVLRHLYRWCLDEEDFTPVLHQDELVFHLAPLEKNLDEGDRSLYARLVIPDLQVAVRFKKTDYFIEELDTHVRSDTFKIINVKKIDREHALPENARVIRMPVREIMDYLYRTRYQADSPAPELGSRLRKAAKKHVAGHVEAFSGEEPMTFFFAPIDPLANEVWAFWHDAGLIIRWASDVDLNNPALWEREHLSVRVFDIEKQVLLSFSQAPGSNAYLSRDHVGRIIYNCTVLGEKRLIPRSPPD